MIRKQSPEEQVAKMQHLIKYGVNEDASKASKPIVEFQKKAANGKTYGIIRESTKYYIMEAPEKNTQVLAEDFSYIGGFNNRKQNEYPSYVKASNALDLKLMAINEAVSNNDKVVISEPIVKGEWTDKLTESMREDINRFKEITSNVSKILHEDKGFGSIPTEHTLPETPISHPSDEKKNAPYVDKTQYDGDKDIESEDSDHKKKAPYTDNGEVSDEEMRSDKKPVINTKPVYSEKEKHMPKDALANRMTKTIKPVRYDEGKTPRLKVTESQLLKLNESISAGVNSRAREYLTRNVGVSYEEAQDIIQELRMDIPALQSAGVEFLLGIVRMYSDGELDDNMTRNKVNRTLQTASEAGRINELDSDLNGMSAREFISEYGNGMNESKHQDYSDYPFPELLEGRRKANKIECNKDGCRKVDDDDETEYEIEIGDDDDDDDEPKKDMPYNNKGLRGLENWEKTWNRFDDDDDGYYYESRRRRMKEDRLYDFGKHPSYQKEPMTTPSGRGDVVNGREWDDESVKGDKPYGTSKGKSDPFDELVDTMAESILATVYDKKKA